MPKWGHPRVPSEHKKHGQESEIGYPMAVNSKVIDGASDVIIPVITSPFPTLVLLQVFE
jgi:hypothetical protein